MTHTWSLLVDCLRIMTDYINPIIHFSLVIAVFSSPLLDIHGAVGCDLPANFHEPTSLACIANHVANACVRAHATVMQGAFGTCSQQIAFAARFGIG